METVTRASKNPLPTQRFNGRSRYCKRPADKIGTVDQHLKAMRGALKQYRKGQDQVERLNALTPIRRLSQDGGKLRHALFSEALSIGHADHLLDLVRELTAEEVADKPLDHGFDLCHEGPGRMASKVKVSRTPAVERLQDALLELRDQVKWRHDHRSA